jgi:hypothetical protein
VAKLPKAFWAYTVVAGVNDRIDFKRGGTTLFATIAPGTYDHPLYYASETSTSLLGAVQLALADADPGNAPWGHGVNSAGRATIYGAFAFQFLFGTGANLARTAAGWMGFDLTDTAAATAVTGQHQHQNGWYGDRSVVFDGRPFQERVGSSTRALDGSVKLIEEAVLESREIALRLPNWKAKIECEPASVAYDGQAHSFEAIERLWRDGAARFRWWPDASVEGTFVDYALNEKSALSFNPKRAARKELYDVSWTLRRVA